MTAFSGKVCVPRRVYDLCFCIAFCQCNRQPLNLSKLDRFQVQQQSEQQATALTALAAGEVQQEAQLQDFQALLEAMQGETAFELMNAVRKAPELPLSLTHGDTRRIRLPAVVSSKQFTLLLSALPHISQPPDVKHGPQSQQVKTESRQRQQRQPSHREQQQQQQQSPTATSAESANGASDGAEPLADAWNLGSGALPPRSAFHESPVSSSSHAA
jgi:hypothetical protein